MSARQTNNRWPPLVGAERLPWYVRARDGALTAAAWCLFAYLLRDAIELAWDYFRYPMFELTSTTPPDWWELWLRMRGYALFIAALMAWLLLWGHVRRDTLAAVLPQTPPPALSPDEHAGALALPPKVVLTCQQARRMVVRFDKDGSIASVDPESGIASG